MRSALLFSAVVVACAALPAVQQPKAPFKIVPKGQECTVGDKFIQKKGDAFVQECLALGDFTYSKIIGCIAPDNEFFALETTYDFKQQAEMGYRFKCTFKNDQYLFNTDGCLMGKQLKYVKDGGQGVAYNNICTCKKNAIVC